MELNSPANVGPQPIGARAERASAVDHGGTTGLPFPPAIRPEQTLDSAQWGMLAFLVSEVAFFGTLITAYLAYLGQDVSGPTPREALSLPLVLVTTLCLLSSSGTIHLAEGNLHHRRERGFLLAWGATIGLGIAFLLGTAYEWRELIYEHQLTIGRNLFGSTFYTLVGFHGLHVTVGVVMMLAVLGLVLAKQLSVENKRVVQLVSWYWHFVDAVWIVVFAVVYLIGR
ncbi:MAG TPA: heme-copper oxidase subunit III [Pirellulales bacterium]|nr:heme-copper oxidase subunit III [Pirellulales bacterium]